MLREETVEPATLELLKRLVSLPELKDFRLVGGTALSLLFGHRKSIDIDLFTDKPLQKESLIPALKQNFDKVITVNDRGNSIYQCLVQNIKVDFVSVKDAFLNPINIKDNIPFADVRDLIALKLNAIKGRGAKKDFWDLATLLQQYTLKELLQFYHDRYNYDDTFAVIRSISYFADGEDDPDPECLRGINWDQVKEIIVEGLRKYYINKN